MALPSPSPSDPGIEKDSPPTVSTAVNAAASTAAGTGTGAIMDMVGSGSGSGTSTTSATSATSSSLDATTTGTVSTKKRQRSTSNASVDPNVAPPRRAPSAAPSDIRPASALSLNSFNSFNSAGVEVDDDDVAFAAGGDVGAESVVGGGGGSAFPSAPATPERMHVEISADEGALGADTGAIEVPNVDHEMDAAPTWPNVLVSDKVQLTRELLDSRMQDGQTWYIVSAQWLGRLQLALGEGDPKKQAANPVEEKDVGPVDNKGLIGEDGSLKKLEDGEAEYVPEELWKAFVAWYGKPTYPLPRRARTVGVYSEVQLDLYPPSFTALRLVSSSDDDPSITGPPPPLVLVSNGATVRDAVNAMAKAALPASLFAESPRLRIRAWILPHPRTSITGSAYPVSRLQQIGGQLIRPADYDTEVEYSLLEDGDVFVVEAALPTGWMVDEDKIPVPEDVGGMEPEAPLAPLFNSSGGNDFFSRYESKKVSSSDSDVKMRSPSPAGGRSSGTTTALRPGNFNGKGSSSTASGYGFTNSKSGKSSQKSYSSSSEPRVPGTLGLGNMGNTCFMNSALQCLAHTQTLVDYFISDVYKEELNPDNPLGMHGAIAEAFGALLHKIWAGSGTVSVSSTGKGAGSIASSSGSKSGGYGGYGSNSYSINSSSYSPREFKSALQRFAPQFSGYQQHDSQELVAFLLDGLHEDLNRILQKPYVEKPDWVEGGGEREMLELARESWDGYLKRNDSVIVDLFQGQYRSTLVCPECQKVSITFDPFMYLTLPLPQTAQFKTTIQYIPYNPQASPVKVPIQITKDASFKEVRNLLGKWMQVDPSHLTTYEVFSHRFYKDLHDGVPVTDMNETSDVMVCYELPCPSQQARSFKRKPEHDFVVPVFLADEPGPKMSSYGRVNVEYFGFPFLMRFAHQEARSVDEIRERVTEGIARWTEHSRDLWNWTEDEVPAGDASASAKQNGDEDEDGEEAMEEVKIELEPVAPEVETVTEITEDGKVRDVQERVIQQVPTPTEEGEDDIADSKAMLIEDLSVTAEPMLRDVSMGADDHSQEAQNQPSRPMTTRRLAAKNNAFTLRLVSDYKKTSVGFGNINKDQPKFTSWDDRQAEAAEEDGFLLREGDAIIVEFEPTVREYFFGSHRRFEHARFDPSQWDTFEHPELLQLRKGSKGPKRGMDLQECLDEFVREERLGEDDLWYCPKCKKHQQASKKFDLWKAPDVLVVHLKRFSSSRAMRDKIDTFVDFPIEGLNLEPMIEERKVARALAAAGVDMEALGVHDDGEPLVYDLFAVDEHLGGLGGGHYRAYAKNHMNSKWYHFDDSFVTESSAENAVNSNAYLLFYQRRTSRPLGGKTHIKIEEAKARGPAPDVSADANVEDESPRGLERQLPTPPSESERPYGPMGFTIPGLSVPFGDREYDDDDDEVREVTNFDDEPVYGDEPHTIDPDGAQTRRSPSKANYEDVNFDQASGRHYRANSESIAPFNMTGGNDGVWGNSPTVEMADLTTIEDGDGYGDGFAKLKSRENSPEFSIPANVKQIPVEESTLEEID